MSSDRIIDKIRKLMAHADSARAIGSEDEAQAFADMVQKLLMEHNLEMEDVATPAQREHEPDIDQQDYRPEAHGNKRTRVRVAWQERLAHAVARANLCRFMVNPRSNVITFVGQKHNLEVCIWSFAILVRAADRLADVAYSERWRECLRAGDVTLCRGFRPAFILGFVSRLMERIEEREAKLRAEQTTALVVYDKNKAAIQKYFNAFSTPVPPVSGREIRDRTGLERGRKAADRVNLDQTALKEGKRQKRELLT